jgi:hypothetical protein
MTDRIYAPWTEQQVVALNNFQRSGVMHPFTCGGDHELHQTLVAEWDGWRCPDEACGYRQTWAHAFMADPNYLSAVKRPGVAEHLAVFEAARFYGSPMAAELAKTKQLLRETEAQLGEERQRTAELSGQLTAALLRIQALQIHEAVQRIPAPAVPACGETLYARPIDDLPTTEML